MMHTKRGLSHALFPGKNHAPERKRGRKMNRKRNVAVLFGGCSPEYKVSLESAYAVASHIDREKYVPILLGITPKGEWFLYTGALENILEDTWHNSEDCMPVTVSLNRTSHALLLIRERRISEISIDAAFPILHGKNGEDGTVQGIFELAGIPLVGCGVLASSLCMDKDRAHKLAHAAGVAVPRSFVLRRNMTIDNIMAQAEALGYPLFVKPVRAGSSYGITKVTEKDQLPAALPLAFSYDDQVIIEEGISGFEVGCAILGNDSLVTGEVDEIELSGGFFNFKEKYTLETSSIHLPARIPQDTAQAIKETAKTIYQVLGCRGFARVDLFLDENGRIVFNEVNTIPGFTAHSRYPAMMAAAGMSFEQVISTVIELAVNP